MPYYLRSTINISNCLFVDNLGTHGGAIAAYSGGSGVVRVNNCRFENNTAYYQGGAIYRGSFAGYGSRSIGEYSLEVTDCVFRGNTAPLGGAVSAWDSSVNINRCSFYGNSASIGGGAIYDSLSASLKVYSSLFAGNRAPIGAAHYAAPASAVYIPHSFTHCSFANNANLNTNLGVTDYVISLQSRDTLRNSILWDNHTNSGAQVAPPGAGAVVNTNIIQGGASLGGAVNTYTFNPLFVSPGLTSAAPFPVSSSYNYRLSLYSLAIDTGAVLPIAAPYHLALDSGARLRGALPDLGAYELDYCSQPLSVTASGPTTFCLPGSVTLTAVATGFNLRYFWNGSATASTASITATASGSYRVILVNDSSSCRASATVNVNAVAAPNPPVTQSGNTLSVPAGYATYQWYLNGVPVAGATAATYNPATNGSYTVRLTTVAGGCTGTTAAYVLRNLGAGGLSLPVGVSVYPNPAGDYLAIDGMAAGSGVRLVSVLGATVAAREPAGGREVLDLSGLAPGSYMLLLSGSDGRSGAVRITKQ